MSELWNLVRSLQFGPRTFQSITWYRALCVTRTATDAPTQFPTKIPTASPLTQEPTKDPTVLTLPRVLGSWLPELLLRGSTEFLELVPPCFGSDENKVGINLKGTGNRWMYNTWPFDVWWFVSLPRAADAGCESHCWIPMKIFDIVTWAAIILINELRPKIRYTRAQV